jgi:hypothetical protein
MPGSKDVIQHCTVGHKHKQAIRFPSYTGNIQLLGRRSQGDYNLIYKHLIIPLFGVIPKL